MQLLRRVPQIILGLALAYAGIGHLTTSRQEFQAQVPTLFKDYADFVVLASGVVEIVLGLRFRLLHQRVRRRLQQLLSTRKTDGFIYRPKDLLSLLLSST